MSDPLTLDSSSLISPIDALKVDPMLIAREHSILGVHLDDGLEANDKGGSAQIQRLELYLLSSTTRS